MDVRYDKWDRFSLKRIKINLKVFLNIYFKAHYLHPVTKLNVLSTEQKKLLQALKIILKSWP